MTTAASSSATSSASSAIGSRSGCGPSLEVSEALRHRGWRCSMVFPSENFRYCILLNTSEHCTSSYWTLMHSQAVTSYRKHLVTWYVQLCWCYVLLTLTCEVWDLPKPFQRQVIAVYASTCQMYSNYMWYVYTANSVQVSQHTNLYSKHFTLTLFRKLKAKSQEQLGALRIEQSTWNERCFFGDWPIGFHISRDGHSAVTEYSFISLFKGRTA